RPLANAQPHRAPGGGGSDLRRAAGGTASGDHRRSLPLRARAALRLTPPAARAFDGGLCSIVNHLSLPWDSVHTKRRAAGPPSIVLKYPEGARFRRATPSHGVEAKHPHPWAFEVGLRVAGPRSLPAHRDLSGPFRATVRAWTSTLPWHLPPHFPRLNSSIVIFNCFFKICCQSRLGISPLPRETLVRNTVPSGSCFSK